MYYLDGRWRRQSLVYFGEPEDSSVNVAYAASLGALRRYAEAKALLRNTIPVAQRVLGEGDQITLTMRRIYAMALYDDPGATLHDLREAVTTLEDMERIMRRVFGGAHPHTEGFGRNLLEARAKLRTRETPSAS